MTFSLLLAVISQYLSLYFGALFFGLEKSPISPILVALLLGILLGNQFDIQSRSSSGLQFCMKQVLRFGIILMGIRLSLVEIINYGLKSLTVVVPCIIITIIVAKIISDRFGLNSRVSSLIAVGTSICGASAIVAYAPTISAKKMRLCLLWQILLFWNSCHAFVPNYCKFLFATDSISVGIFLGASIHETAQVVGAGMMHSQQYSQVRGVGSINPDKAC